ncbi:Solute carrier family 35 (UDP-N-acetylglucosamine (UDP-GlcNAc) transporter) member 3 [Fasciola hepatica]|uniref:Solute carrier family 35 (UDP-N-acetylglucosamine (UDP-GlcNAc) transporter) member 3 n=1 Tax=Fasciola hepatica TaxID=6192 RepID=A0A4E0RB54_FASHE|nr:Solute carrier family 35 (UDP-N-acetylglucosamine (UDP-GlcNAc) transporter) member 3 [Fasciola hepatica]
MTSRRSSRMDGSRSRLIKYCSLVFLTIQTTCLVLCMRISRTQNDSQLYLISTIVVCAEFSKLCVCIIMIIINEKFDFKRALSIIYEQVFVDYKDTLKVLIPSALYTVQNNLLYVAISNLNAVAYQILYQSKIFTTALFMVTMLNRKLFSTQWISLALLCTGIVLSQWNPNASKPGEGNTHSYSSTAIGILAVSMASVSSGFAGVYFEKILKGTAPSIWIRNIQLAIFGIAVGLFGVYTYDGKAVIEKGFFQGYTLLAWLVVALQTCSGLGVAFVIKYADNILKGFAAGLSIILSSFVSYFLLNDFSPSTATFAGAAMVIGATILYGHVPRKQPETKTPV